MRKIVHTTVLTTFSTFLGLIPLTSSMVFGSLMFSVQPSYACGRFEPAWACKARKAAEEEIAARAREAKIAAYRTNPQYIQARLALTAAKKVVRLTPGDCKMMVDRGSMAGASTAAVKTASVSVGLVVRAIGKDAGRQLCKDSGLGY